FSEATPSWVRSSRSCARSLDAYAYNHNSFLKQGFSENLPLSSIRATVKSVGRWTWDRYTGDRRCHRGANGYPI
ncbi:RepA, partial [Pseudomonas amygdali pv. myricae]